MRTPDQIAQQARTRYDNNWRDWLTDPPDAPAGSFTLAPPDVATIAARSQEVGQWIRTWRAWEQTHPGRLREATRRTKLGAQPVYTHVDLTTVADLAALDPDRAVRWRKASTRWKQLSILPRASHQRLKPYLQKILVDLPEADFQTLLAAADWFAKNPRSGHTIRQVPVEGMHTKWLARHRVLVLACLGTAQAEETSQSADSDLDQADLDALGLKALPVHVDVILADPADRNEVEGLQHLRAPVPQLAKLPLSPRTVVVIENKESAYLVPDLAGVVVVHSLGNHLNVLADLPWIASARCLYWGDLDRAGLTLLSRARELIPGLESILMDEATFRRYARLAVPDTTKADAPSDTLRPAEADALALLRSRDGYHRLEQERLPASHVVDVITETCAAQR